MGTNTSLSPLYGWSKKGRRAYGSVPRNLKARTPLSAFEHDHRRDGAIAGRARRYHRPGLRDLRGASSGAHAARRPGGGHGQPLKTHKGERIREFIEQRGCEPLYLPSYSPEYNPIEEAFGKMKGLSYARSRRVVAERTY
jgi:hypothetical protein